MTEFRRERFELLEKFTWMRRVRVLAALFVFIIYFFVKKLSVFSFPFIPFTFCCFVEGAVNQPYPFITSRLKALNFLTYIHLVLDIVLISAIIHYLGGIEFAFFSIAYPLIIVLAGIMLSRNACYTVAFISSIAYSAIIALEYFKFIPHNPLFGLKLDGLHQFGIVAANILFFYFVAFLSGLSSELIEEKTKKLEREKRFSEEVIATMADGLVVIDEDGRIQELNRAIVKMTGFVREEMIGFSISQKLLSGPSSQTVSAAILSAGSLGEVRDIEAQLVARDSTNIPVKINISMLDRDAKGRKSFVAIIRDITRDKATDKLKTEFISTITHELLTPLTSIIGFVKMILEKKMGDLSDLQNNALQIVTKQAKHLKDLIESMLDFSRMETGKLDLHPEPTQISEIVQETISEMEPQITEKGLKVSVKINSAIPEVLADRSRIHRAFTNILGNAIKFTPRGRNIEIHLWEDRGFLNVCVKDEGIGIFKENFEKIFDRFYQVDNTLTRVVGGAGVGLAIAKEIVGKHGGRIWVESDGLGLGSRFMFTLPVS